MRYLSLGEIVDLHQTLLDQTGGATGLLTREQLTTWLQRHVTPVER